MKATISKNPLAKYYGEAEEVETVEIGHCMVAIQRLAEKAKLVNENPTQFDQMAQHMAYIIRMIEVAVFHK